MNIGYGYKIWLEYDGKPILGKGRYHLLMAVRDTSSLQESAKKIGICTKTAYNYIKKIEKRLGKKIVVSKKGGIKGGASIELNDAGLMLIKEFETLQNKLR